MYIYACIHVYMFASQSGNSYSASSVAGRCCRQQSPQSTICASLMQRTRRPLTTPGHVPIIESCYKGENTEGQSHSGPCFIANSNMKRYPTSPISSSTNPMNLTRYDSSAGLRSIQSGRNCLLCWSPMEFRLPRTEIGTSVEVWGLKLDIPVTTSGSEAVSIWGSRF